MSQARAVTATFNRIPASRYVLTITKGGSGSGTVTSTPDGIACGATCGPSFDSATVVTLAAAPGTGSVFAGWDGPCTGTGTCQVTMSRAWSVTATFNAGYYRLTVRGGGTGSGTVISSPSGISCTFIHGTAGSGCSGLFPYGTTVSLNPVAFDGDNFGGWSGACSGTQACQVVVPRDTAVTVGFTLLSPNTPAALAAASRAANSVVITWRRSPEADLYYLMRSGISGGPYATVHSGRDTTVTDAGLAPSTTYYYVVRAWNSAGWSSFSGELALTTTAGAPLAPTGLAVGGPTATSLAVSWNASAQAAGYQLLRSASATGTYAEVYRGAGRAVTDTGLATGTSYYYRVKAFNAYGASDASETKSGTTLTPAQAVPGVPTGLTVGNPTASSLAIGWSPSALAAGYQLLRSASAAGTYLEVFKGAGTSVTDSGLTAGTTYYYKVRAYSAYGSSDLSDARSGTTLSAAHAPPAVPSGLVVGNPTTSSLAISWSASAQATGYQLKRSTSAAGTYVEVSRGAGTSVSDSGLAAGTTYYYRVRAYNSSGASDLSDYASGTTLAPAAYETAYLKAVFGRGGFYWTTNVAKWQSGTIWIRYSDLVAHHIASPAWSRCYDAVLVLDPHDHDGDGRPSSDHDRQGWSGSDRDRQGSHDGQAWADSDHDRRDDDGRPGSGSDHNRSGDGRSGSAGDHDRRDGGGQGSRDRAEGDSDDAPSFFFSEHAPRSNMGLDLDPTTTSVTVEITGVLEHRDRRDWDGRFWTRGGPWNGRFDFDRPDADCQTLTRTIQIQSLPGGGPARIDIGYWFSDPRVRWGAGIHEVTLTFNGWLVPAGQDATVWRCTGDFNWHGDHEHAYPHGERDRACELKR
jgi:fibronectin type 3 domain-containing protein